jgi:hypothetical protein
LFDYNDSSFKKGKENAQCRKQLLKEFQEEYLLYPKINTLKYIDLKLYIYYCKILKYIFFCYYFVYIFNLGGFWKGGGHGMTENKSVGWHTYHQPPSGANQRVKGACAARIKHQALALRAGGP